MEDGAEVGIKGVEGICGVIAPLYSIHGHLIVKEIDRGKGKIGEDGAGQAAEVAGRGSGLGRWGTRQRGSRAARHGDHSGIGAPALSEWDKDGFGKGDSLARVTLMMSVPFELASTAGS
jgi:hypothetical protein